MALFIIHCSLFIGITAHAQTFTQRLQTPVSGEGRVILHQNAAIDALVNGAMTAPQTQPTRPAQTSQQPLRPTQQGQQPAHQNQHPLTTKDHPDDRLPMSATYREAYH